MHIYINTRAGQQGPTRTLTAALKRSITQLLGTYSTTQVKYYKQTRKLEKSTFSMILLKHLKIKSLVSVLCEKRRCTSCTDLQLR